MGIEKSNSSNFSLRLQRRLNMKRLFENVYEKEVFNCCDKLVSINEKCISSSNLSKKCQCAIFMINIEYRLSKKITYFRHEQKEKKKKKIFKKKKKKKKKKK